MIQHAAGDDRVECEVGGPIIRRLRQAGREEGGGCGDEVVMPRLQQFLEFGEETGGFFLVSILVVRDVFGLAGSFLHPLVRGTVPVAEGTVLAEGGP